MNTKVGGLVWWPTKDRVARFEFIPAETEISDGHYVLPPQVLDDIHKAMLMVHLHMEMDDLNDKCHGPSSPDMEAAESMEKDELIINWSPASDPPLAWPLTSVSSISPRKRGSKD